MAEADAVLPGTVRDHDRAARTGTVLLDDGTVLEYGADAFAAGGLLLLRSGQRVHLEVLDGTAMRISLPG